MPRAIRTVLYEAPSLMDPRRSVTLSRTTEGTEVAGSGERETYRKVSVTYLIDGALNGSSYPDNEEGRDRALLRFANLTGLYFPAGMSPLHR